MLSVRRVERVREGTLLAAVYPRPRWQVDKGGDFWHQLGPVSSFWRWRNLNRHQYHLHSFYECHIAITITIIYQRS